MELECDVLVVGCGPAGAAAAISASESGADVVCVERKGTVGEGICCAEGVGSYLLPLLPFRLPKKFLSWRIDGIVFSSPTRTAKRSGGYWSGYTIDRAGTERWLAEKAANAGARIMTGTSLSTPFFSKGILANAGIIARGKKSSIRPSAVVAADGSHSILRQSSPLPKAPSKAFATVYSMEVHGMGLSSPHFEQIFFGPFAPNGYAYIFPKSKTVANVGVGICGVDREPATLRRFFERFISMDGVAEQMGDAHFAKDKSGNPLVDGRFLKSPMCGNVFLAGDSAAQNIKPFVEGIVPSLICGWIAGNCAAKSANNGQPDYCGMVRRKLGGVFAESDSATEKLYSAFRAKEHRKYELLFDLGARVSLKE